VDCMMARAHAIAELYCCRTPCNCSTVKRQGHPKLAEISMPNPDDLASL
jgi:hypothetical protein